eukprot:Opistho-1_new@29475
MALNTHMKQFEKHLSNSALMNQIEQKTGIPKLYVAMGGTFVFCFSLAVGFAAQLLTNLVGFLYPAYASFKAIESSDKNDDTRWLIYWVVYAFFNILEYFTDTLLHWIPFYYFAKIFVLLFLMLPSTDGANLVYYKFVRPYLLNHETQIDGALRLGRKEFTEAANEIAREGRNAVLRAGAAALEEKSD